MRRFADGLPAGARVVDIGAGDGPYRELFAHCEYVTVDWANSPHEDARSADVVSSIEDLPIEPETFDAAFATQVLEHVPSPLVVLREMHRVLRPSGTLLVTVPFIWEEHEQPFDFQRFASSGLAALLEAAGFTEISVRARNDYLTTLAQMMRNARWAIGRAPDGLDARRDEVSGLLDEVSAAVLELAPLDTKRIFPLGWEATACRP